MNLKVSDAKREEGFTLIELLVVVIIIGILAAIAIPIFLNQRERAWIRAAQSDVRNVAIEVETFFNDNFVYPSGTAEDLQGDPITEGGVVEDAFEATDIDPQGDVVISPNVSIDYVLADDDSGFCLEATHELIEEGDDFVALYDSLAGGDISNFDVENGCTGQDGY